MQVGSAEGGPHRASLVNDRKDPGRCGAPSTPRPVQPRLLPNT
jgi:hypothetical protein